MSRKWFYQLLLLMNARSREDYFSKKSFVVALGMFIFALGAFLGKQFSDRQNQSRLVQLSNCQNSVAAKAKNQETETTLTNEIDKKVDPLQELSHLSNYAPAAAQMNQMAEKELERQIASEKVETKQEIVKAEPIKKSVVKKARPAPKKEEKKLSLYKLESNIPVTTTQSTQELDPVVEEAKKELLKQEQEEKEAALQTQETTQEQITLKPKKSRAPSAIKKSEISKLESVDYFGIDALPIGTYTLQLLSTQNEEEAKSFVEKLGQDGIHAFYIKFQYTNNSAPVYRVCSGAFKDLNLAEKHFYQELDSKNPNLNFFVRKILK
ncbi:MAG: SPOR domain-containing protein [Oligoflexia bacterium]|nr:SPOR domain-containing protein [Oligoflexia bacterium]